ncbi:LppU/SCO3897 family protein [Streptomyces vinaceus]|uniref:LppU/SCO3897 family protein n=1 Tax=Streptomyces vinaceus TaxID=1960 RepID=UPI003687104C
MTADRLPAVDHASLSLGDRLGQGGQGSIHRVTNRRINEADNGGWDVVYKEYNGAVLPGLDGGALAAMVDLLNELGEADGRWLCEKTAWPAAVVQRQGQTSGFLMRAAPDRFHFDYQSLSGPATGTRRLANLEYLLNDDAYVAGIGLTISDRDRLLLLADLASTLTRLHRLDIAVGDLSPKNLLFTTSPQPECFVIDCDAVRLRGATVLAQAETPDWQLPVNEEKATPTGDVYKLALLAVRLIARDQIATDPAALSALSPALGDLARSSLSPDPSRRPAPALWTEQLRAVAMAQGTGIPASGRPNLAGPLRPQQNRPVTPGRPPGASKPNPAIGVAIAATIAVIVLAFISTSAGRGSDSAAGTTAVPSSVTSSPTGPAPSPQTPTPTPTPTPPTMPSALEPAPLDKAFGGIAIDDCLSNYLGTDPGWTPEAPTVTSCSDTEAYYRVLSIRPSAGCPSDDATWRHRNRDGTETYLCVRRNYMSGQCMFAVADGKTLSVHFNAISPCGSRIPDNYQYVVQISKVYPGGAPADACGTDRLWKTGHDTVYCGRAIWKRDGLPDL